MTIRIIGSELVRELAPIDDVIEWVAEALVATSAGETILPLRQGMDLGSDIGTLGMMSNYMAPGLRREKWSGLWVALALTEELRNGLETIQSRRDHSVFA